MALHQLLLASMPDRVQDRLFGLLSKTAWLRSMPIIDMLLSTLEVLGGRRAELDTAMAAAGDLGNGLALAFETQAARTSERASEAGATIDDAYRAALYTFVAEWAARDATRKRLLHALAIERHDRFRKLERPPSQKVVLGGTPMTGLLRLPDAPPVGAVVLVPGNEQTKEWMRFFEEAALARHLATLAIDPPGYGDSFYAGIRVSRQEEERCARGSLELFASMPETGALPVASFGLSMGGLYAHYMAGCASGFACSASIGAPHDLLSVAGLLPSLQRRRLFESMNLRSMAELRAFAPTLDIDAVLARGKGPSLIFHGTNDVVVPQDEALRLAAVLGSKSEVRLQSGDDHMCTRLLRASGPGEIFDWIRRVLESAGSQR